MSWWQKLAGALDTGPVGEHEEHMQVELAAAALLLEMAEADLEVDASELKRIRVALAHCFHLSAEQIDHVVASVHEHPEREASYYRYVQIINQHCDQAKKAEILEQLWRVAFADGRLDRYEEHYLRKLASLLHLPHRVFLQARHRIEEQIQST